MVRLERSLLDRAINVSVLNKRQLSRPLKHNLRTKGKIGYVDLLTNFISWIEILFNPKNSVEAAVADVVRFVHPYIAWITYRFHVEKAREIGKL